MKKILIASIFISIHLVNFAQNFTISELVKIIDYDQDDLDTYLTQKGFRYYETINEYSHTGICYVYYSNGGRLAYISTAHYFYSDTDLISFQTPNSSSYLKIKSELKTLGYKFIDSTNLENSVCLNYKKGNIEVSLYSIQMDNDVVYEISVSK